MFDGIGVFPLAASLHGITPLWASEIEKAPVSITKRHFPAMLHLGNITKLHGGKILPVDIIAFGSPCTGLSSAGTRSGLAGAQSSLFFQAIRIINEMRRATDGRFPTLALWENVASAFASNDRMDFRTVLESFADTEIPMPASGRWANAGMVRGGCPDIAWRLLDARHWGSPRLPQRRRRIFLLADFGGQRAAEILYRPRGLLAPASAGGESGLPSAEEDRIPATEAGRGLPVIHPFQPRRMRGNAKQGNKAGFISSFGRPTDPFPTLLASEVTMFSLWHGDDYENGIIRYLTPSESERLMGLPEGWTKYGVDGNLIADGPRYKSIGNAIALPCAEYIMQGIAEALRR